MHNDERKDATEREFHESILKYVWNRIIKVKVID